LSILVQFAHSQTCASLSVDVSHQKNMYTHLKDRLLVQRCEHQMLEQLYRMPGEHGSPKSRGLSQAVESFDVG
jgi:hypothetical protein